MNASDIDELITDALTKLDLPDLQEFGKVQAFSIAMALGYDVEWGDMPNDVYGRREVVDFIAMMEEARRWFPNHRAHRRKLTPDEMRCHKAREAHMADYAEKCSILPLHDLIRLMTVDPNERYRRLAGSVLMSRLGLFSR